MPEPSVLDYVKSLLPWSKQRIEIPAAEGEPQPSSSPEEPDGRPSRPYAWRSLLAVVFGLFAQLFFEPPQTSPFLGVAFYLIALGILLWAVLRGEWQLASPPASDSGNDPLTFRRSAFLISVIFAVLAFLFFTNNEFNGFNLTLWLISLGSFGWSLWLRDPNRSSLWQRLRTFLRRGNWQITINRWTVVLLIVTVIVVFFRIYHIQQTPAEPFSDHAEKILDVYDVSQGQTHIFFPRNTGREAIQMYWTLVISWVFGTGLTFLTLKIGTVLIGLFTLPFMYLLGKEIAGPRVGLLAFVLAGIGYWPNVIARIGLRFPLYPLFAAPLLLFLIRGLRTRNRNDFILAGIFLGLGLHGYTPFRIVPFLVIAAFILYVVHSQSKGARQDALLWLVIVGLMSLLIFLPLLRYATENSALFSYRALTRLGSLEQPLPAPWPQIFLSNSWNALRMFNWNDGVIWVHSLPNRPALDVVSAVLFLAGVVLLCVRYAQKRHWLDLFLLLSIPILLLPSILSLAFPDENPSLNRTAGALVPVFLVAAMALDGFITALAAENRRTLWAYGMTGILLLWSASQNFDLVFRQFDQNFRDNAWNTSDMGAVIKEFGFIYGETDTVWIVPFPYWADTRLPGIWAGIPNRDFAMWPEQLPKSLSIPGPKLFMAKADLRNPSQDDRKSVELLKQLYPQGSLSLRQSTVPGRDFWIYFVPALSTP
jgi:hypothetical protein